jgi:cytochrome c1
LAPRASRGRKHSKGNTLAEELPRTHANDARAPHTSPARAAATPPRALRQAKARKPTTSPTAFNRLTRQTAQALFRTKQGTTSKLRR